MSRRQRARIVRTGPGETIPRLDPLPPGTQDLGAVRRGDQAGRLLRLASGRCVLGLADGATTPLDQDKVAALLAAEADA